MKIQLNKKDLKIILYIILVDIFIVSLFLFALLWTSFFTLTDY